MFLLCLAVARARAPSRFRSTTGCVPTRSPTSCATRARRSIIRSATEVDGSEPLTEAVAAHPDDIGALFYTSGTTGKPKGAELTHRALVGNISAAAAWPARLHRDEAVFSLPIAHIMGFIVLMGYACAGIPVYLTT